MGRHPSIVIGLVALSVLAIFVVFFRFETHNLHVRCYFQDAGGLQAGAPVRVAGVNVGKVTTVRVRPELRDHPVEVLMLLQTSYDLRIPNDAVVTLESAGMLGQTYPEIDIRSATGPPLEDGGTLKTAASQSPNTQQLLLDCLTNISEHKPCDAKK